ncbi:MAG: response regulator [Thermodesulfovibrionales bacterium]
MKKIMVVDDNDEFRTIVKDILGGEEFAITDFSDGMDAITEFSISRPDVVILDHHMPNVTGIDLLRALRRIDSRVPVIMLTASTETDLSREALQYGAADFISKPPDFKELIFTVKRLSDNK